MAEDSEERAFEKAAFGGAADPAALAIALGQPGALDPRVAVFLDKQGRLVDLEIRELIRESRVRHWSLRVRHISDVLRLTFEFGLALVIGTIGIALAVAIWSAAHENGLVFESFSVPPGFEQRGLTGQVIANEMIDRIAAMRARTFGVVSPSLDTAGGRDDLRIQIPDTGISLTDLYGYVARRLGHAIPIAGEAYVNGTSVSLAVRVAGAAARVYTGPSLDGLVNQAAEDLMAQSDPGRYGMYLFQAGHLREALKFFPQAVADASPEKLADIYKDWAFVLQAAGDFHAVIEKANASLAIEPNSTLAAGLALGAETVLSHDQRALSGSGGVLRAMAGDKDLSAQSAKLMIYELRDWDLAETGNYSAAASIARGILRSGSRQFTRFGPAEEAQDLALGHDLAAARRVAAASGFESDAAANSVALYAMLPPLPWFTIYRMEGDWTSALREITAAVADAAKPGSDLHGYMATFYTPWLAYARALAGDPAGAEALVRTTPLDCYLCVRVRGSIAAARKNWRGAAYWFSRAVVLAPAIPFAYSDWGEMLLRKGDYDGAIEKFSQANQKSPRFADPLEMWGEALMLKNRSDLALAKFAEAGKYAPNWGRLQLKWGEALLYAGRRNDAKNHFAFAASLELSAADRAALARLRAAHG